MIKVVQAETCNLSRLSVCRILSLGTCLSRNCKPPLRPPSNDTATAALLDAGRVGLQLRQDFKGMFLWKWLKVQGTPKKISHPKFLYHRSVFVNWQCSRLPTVWAWEGQPDVSNLSKKVGVSRHDVNSGLIYHILYVIVHRWSPQFCSYLILLWKLATLQLKPRMMHQPSTKVTVAPQSWMKMLMGCLESQLGSAFHCFWLSLLWHESL